MIAQQSTSQKDIWVSLDLETTGLSPDRDQIIEIGAVKFQGYHVIDTFQTFVNPYQNLSEFTKRYTSISQADVDEAPSFKSVTSELASFVGQSSVLGHNIAFDMGFLDRKGLRISNPRSDTWEMAFVLFPGQPDYSLAGLAARLKVAHPRPHRALEDALVTKDVFLRMLEEMSHLDVLAIAEMRRIGARSPWLLSHLLGKLDTKNINAEARSDAPRAGIGFGITGLDTRALGDRIHNTKALRPNQETRELDVDFVTALLKQGSPLADVIPGFEERTQQVDMARAVTEAMNRKDHLIVEAGTGVGKSLAYLLPALLYASLNNKRVVVSTNTINLQEQLLHKDVPNVLKALACVDEVSAEKVTFAQLKGRANYLCLNRWYQLRSSDDLSENEARLLAKTLVWLQSTFTGDRSELNLGNRRTAGPWERLSAQGASKCQGMGGPCFLRAAREKAAASHLVIVNHALLLSDLTTGGTLIPDHDVLIVDEAHNLEDEATRHLGFALGQDRFVEHLRSLVGERGLFDDAVAVFRGSSVSATRRDSVVDLSDDATSLIPRLLDQLTELFSKLAGLLSEGSNEVPFGGQDFRVTDMIRKRSAWSQLEIHWENVDLSLATLDSFLNALGISLEGLEEAGLVNYEELMTELGLAQQNNVELRQKLRQFIPHPNVDDIYWIARTAHTGNLVLYSAPLHVGETLDRILYSKKDSVIMTGATLSTEGTFKYICERIGFSPATDLLLGSPFDYPNVAQLCVPIDMPEPTSWAYQGVAEQAITEAALALNGRVMVLFTSHASLQATAVAIRGGLAAQGISVLAQGVDGPPSAIMKRFKENSNSVLLGTASFWEGVDLAGEQLKVLIVMRLPFNVPSEPVFSARSELYEDSFRDYSIPEAILRLRQGFGRLIRTKSDRGVVVILDRRIHSRSYGKVFLNSLPPVTFKTCSLRGLKEEIREWIGG